MSAQTATSIEVLLVEDNPRDAALIERHLERAAGDAFDRISPTHVESLDAAVDRLRTGGFDVVLLDLGLSESSGIDTLDRLQERVSDGDGVSRVPVVVLTGLNDDRTAVESIQRGAQDYLVKDDIDGTVLKRSVRYAIERHSQERELHRQNERLDQFVSVVSHDLRNPLTIAKGHLEIAAETGDPSAFETALDALDRMDELVDDLLTLAREGESVDDPVPVDLAGAARECWATVETAEMDLVVDTDLTLLADASRFQQLLGNLFRNAREHAGDGATVRVATVDDGASDAAGGVSEPQSGDGFYVEDDGPGIPADEREAVFEPGFTTRKSGTGFGLNIVRRVAEAHGWRAVATDGSENGARFEFRGVDRV